MELKVWFIFLITDFILSVTPGPAVFLISTQGLKYGARPSYIGSLGVTCGNLIYFVLSALGLGSLILATGNLFEWIKIAGAIYLIGTGLLMCYHSFKKNKSPVLYKEMSQNSLKSFTQGLVTQISNPKAIIYFVALLPQFIDPAKNMLLQFTLLGLTNVVIETLVLMLYGWAAAKSKNLAGQNSTFVKWQDRVSGFILVSLGLNLLFLKNSTK